MRFAPVASLLATLLLARQAAADFVVHGAGAKERHPDDRLAYDLRIDIPLTLGLVIGGAALQAGYTGPQTCNWCERAPDGSSDLNGVDSWTRDAIRWEHADVAQRMSDVTGYVIVPLVGVVGGGIVAWGDGRFHEVWANGLIATEAAAVSGLLTQLVKYAAGRERPGYHAATAEERAERKPENGSFWSGHSSMAFSFATASGMVASLRGYRAAWAIWAVGLTFASATAYLRVAGDRHYLSDTLSGAASGAAIGVVVPLLHHVAVSAPAPRAGRVRLVPYGAGVGLTGAF
ncbi:MAG: phosphatase PAP2 family protein [Polyangiaceae bacterium]